MYLCDRVNISGGCNAAVTSRTRFWCVELGECNKFVYVRKVFSKSIRCCFHELGKTGNSVSE